MHAATLTDSAGESLSTITDPATRRTTRTSRPPTTALMPIKRMITRRRPRASQSAIAHSAIGTTQSHKTEHLEQLRQVLGRLQLVGLDDRDLTGVRRQTIIDVADDGDPVAELDDERSQIQNDVPALCLESPRVAFQHVDERAVSLGDRADPQLLDPRPLEQCFCHGLGARADAARDRAGQPFQLRRQPLVDRRLHIDVVEELVDEARGDLIADRVICDQLTGRVLDGAGVEGLVADVAREQGDDREERADDDEDPGEQHAPHGR